MRKEAGLPETASRISHPTTRHCLSLPPQALETAPRAQLNPKLMMVMEGRDPCPAGTAERGAEGREG